MNDEEIIETLKTIANDGTIKYYYNDKAIENINNAINLIFKQQKEIEARLEEIDSLYKMISAKYDEIERVKDELKEERALNVEALKTLKECVHKDKIKEKIEKYKKEKNNMTQIVFSKYGKTQQTFKQAVNNEVIRVLEELLGG